MELPDPVVSYLQAQFLSATRPFCFLVDAQYRLLDNWGRGGWCGLDGIEPGADMRAEAAFLIGISTSTAQRLDFLVLPNRTVANVHIVPHGEKCFVILLDASEDHAAIQSRQQNVNELRLLQVRQNRFIARQRDLIGELVETKSELDHLRREAERTSADKTRFIAMMSHEFRTPLASIINYAELAADSAASSSDIGKSVETISRSARHLTSLVEAVLDDASLNAGQIELIEQDFDMRDLLGDMAAMMAPLAAEKGLSFATYADPDMPDLIYADEIHLRQILINLLGNAVKFTVDGGVTLTATYSEGRLVVSVSDTGPGISVEDQERVFRAFERGSDSGASGAGLGLTITLQLANLLRGEISLDSMPGEGCTVSVHVPVKPGGECSAKARAALPTPDRDTVAMKPLSILICDDDRDMIALIEHYLHRSGYGLITSDDGLEAVAKALKYDPDLVILDCNVPGVSGEVAAKMLRDRGYEKPIIALTASKLSAEQQRAFTRFFRKPAPMQELLAEVKRLTH